jgi:hypothetical protein
LARYEQVVDTRHPVETNRRRVALRTLSTAAWVIHNLGLAVSFGGSVFGKAALNPNLDVISSGSDRGKLLNTTWNRFNAISAGSFIA